MAPWVIEAEAPAVWADRWAALSNARAERAERERKRAKKGDSKQRLV